MTKGKHSPLPMAVSAIALAALCGSSAALAQQTTELDLTINVIQAGETPRGFINRLELPPFDSIIAAEAAAQAQAEVIAETVEETVTISDNASQVATDTIREIISVDGTVRGVIGGGAGGVGGGIGGGVGGGVGGGTGAGVVVEALPPAIVDILNPGLPLNDTLTETSNRLNGVVDNLPALGQPGSASDLGSVTSGGVSGGVLSNATIDSSLSNDSVIDSSVNANADAIVDNLDVQINGSVDGAVNDIVNDANSVPLEDLQDLPVSDTPAGDSLVPVTDGIPEIPGL